MQSLGRSKCFILKPVTLGRHSARAFESEHSGPPEGFRSLPQPAGSPAECREKRKERFEGRPSPQGDRATHGLKGQGQTHCLPNSHALRKMPTPSAPPKDIPETQSSRRQVPRVSHVSSFRGNVRFRRLISRSARHETEAAWSGNAPH